MSTETERELEDYILELQYRIKFVEQELEKVKNAKKQVKEATVQTEDEISKKKHDVPKQQLLAFGQSTSPIMAARDKAASGRLTPVSAVEPDYTYSKEKDQFRLAMYRRAIALHGQQGMHDLWFEELAPSTLAKYLKAFRSGLMSSYVPDN